jgi:hypothetical protein
MELENIEALLSSPVEGVLNIAAHAYGQEDITSRQLLDQVNRIIIIASGVRMGATKLVAAYREFKNFIDSLGDQTTLYTCLHSKKVDSSWSLIVCSEDCLPMADFPPSSNAFLDGQIGIVRNRLFPLLDPLLKPNPSSTPPTIFPASTSKENSSWDAFRDEIKGQMEEVFDSILNDGIKYQPYENPYILKCGQTYSRDTLLSVVDETEEDDWGRAVSVGKKCPSCKDLFSFNAYSITPVANNASSKLSPFIQKLQTEWTKYINKAPFELDSDGLLLAIAQAKMAILSFHPKPKAEIPNVYQLSCEHSIIVYPG